MADSSQKFIARNRAPRVQIEYDVELYGAEKKVQLPFVMGVMSDLLGKSTTPQPSVADRKFLDIDVDSFDSRMKAMAPRAAFSVPNSLTQDGNLEVDLTFERMDDFSPGAIATKVPALRPLLEARQQLQTLMAYMDGKSGAEGLIEHILKNPSLLATLAAGTEAGTQDQENALDSLRGIDPPRQPDDHSDAILDDLANTAPPAPTAPDRELADILQDVPEAASDVEPEDVDNSLVQALESLGDMAPQDDGITGADAAQAAILGSLAGAVPENQNTSEGEDLSDLLQDLAAVSPVDTPPRGGFGRYISRARGPGSGPRFGA